MGIDSKIIATIILILKNIIDKMEKKSYFIFCDRIYDSLVNFKDIERLSKLFSQCKKKINTVKINKKMDILNNQIAEKTLSINVKMKKSLSKLTNINDLNNTRESLTM